VSDPGVSPGLASAAAWSWRVLVVAGAAALGAFVSQAGREAQILGAA